MMKNILYVHAKSEQVEGSRENLLDIMNRLDKPDFNPILWTDCQTLANKAIELGIEVYCDNFDQMQSKQSTVFSRIKKQHLANLSLWWELVSDAETLIEHCDIDMIHVNNAQACQWMSMAARHTRTPLVAYLYREYTWQERLRLGLHLNTNIITSTRDFSYTLSEEGYPDSQLFVVNMGLDTQAMLQQVPLNVRQALNLDPTSKLLMTNASHLNVNEQQLLMETFRQLLKRNPNTHLVVLGSVLEDKSLLHLVSDLKLTHKVHWVGNQEQPHRWLRDADLYLGCHGRNLQRDLLIAAFAGVPIIANANGGSGEAVQHNQTGYLFSHQNATILSETIALRFSEPEPWLYRASRARQKALRYATLGRQVEQLQAIYHNVICPDIVPKAPSLLKAGQPIVNRYLPWLQQNPNLLSSNQSSLQ